jgi:hypothetical protein
VPENLVQVKWIAAALGLLCVVAVADGQAQVYKWVDASGRVHYGDRPPEAAKVEQIRMPPPAPASASRTPTWQEREAEYKKRKAQPKPWSPPQFSGVSPSKSYYSNEVDTDANRCRLARDVLSGAARHSNGKPTDQNDREIAQRDVGSFCF